MAINKWGYPDPLYVEVDPSCEKSATEILWETEKLYKFYGFVTYDKEDIVFDILNPISKIFKIGSDLYVKHHLGSDGVVKVNTKDMRELGWTCRVEKAHFPYMCDEGEYYNIDY